MQPSIAFECGNEHRIVERQKKLGRELMQRYMGRQAPLEMQRSIWFTTAAGHEGRIGEAVALAAHVDDRGKFIPAAMENGVEIIKPPVEHRKVYANTLLILGEPTSLPTLALTDAIPCYLRLCSGRPTILIVERKLGDEINRMMGFQYAAVPICMPAGFVSMVATDNPAKSFCARAIVFGREAPKRNHFYIDALGGTGAVATLLADDNISQLALRAWNNWTGDSDWKFEFETQPLPPAPCGAENLLGHKT